MNNTNMHDVMHCSMAGLKKCAVHTAKLGRSATECALPIPFDLHSGSKTKALPLE